MQALERAVDDPDRDVRVAAVRALGARSHRGVLGRLEATVKGKAIRDADLTEKMAFFEAFGAMCGEAGTAFLDGLLNGKSLLGRREDPELRACAAIALGKVGGKKAQESLQRASAEKDVHRVLGQLSDLVRMIEMDVQRDFFAHSPPAIGHAGQRVHPADGGGIRSSSSCHRRSGFRSSVARPSEPSCKA